MNIKISANIPDSTYFAMSDVSPDINGETITLYHGKGERRGWGAPQVTSTIIVQQPNFIAVHVGFSHKHRGGQGWFYFVAGERKTWTQLPDDLRQIVLDNERKAPSWAKSPGSLRAAAKKPAQNVQLAYKLVKVDGERMLSLYDGSTQYVLGKRLAQKAQPDHSGGFYAFPTAEGCKSLWTNGNLVPESKAQGVSKLALLEVEVSGTIVEYGAKLAATYLKPVRVIEIIEVASV